MIGEKGQETSFVLGTNPTPLGVWGRILRRIIQRLRGYRRRVITESILILNRHGETCAMIGTDGHDLPTIRFINPGGASFSFILGSNSEGNPTFLLNDSVGTNRIHLGVEPGRSGLIVSDDCGLARVATFIEKDLPFVGTIPKEWSKPQ